MDFRFSLKYVQPGGSHLSALESGNQIFVYHQPTACRVHDNGATREKADRFRIEEVVSLRSLWCVQTEKLTNSKQFVWVLMISCAFFQVRGQLRAIAIVNLHPKSPRATRHRLTYMAHSKNA